MLVFGLIISIPATRWRTEILLYRATGRIQDITWSDLIRMLRPGSDIYLERLAETRNPYLAIESPRHSKSDIEAGKQLFLEKCAPCHGEEGRGGPGGPSLNDRVFRQGHSDWALYRTITLGIPNTAMVGREMPRDDVWRLVSYLQKTLVETPPTGSALNPVTIAPVTTAELSNATDQPSDWLTYSGSYSSQRHSGLIQINRQNVAQLRVAWARQLSTLADKVETTPIVRGTTMFVTEPPNRVLGLDATSGRVLWTFTHDLPSRLLLCCGPVNRGVALLGSRVFVGTLDAHVIALDANTGRVLWDVPVDDSSKGYSITGAPLAIDDMVVTGVGGGEYGIRGFIDAYDAATGKRRWRFYTVPAKGEPGSETWEGGPGPTGGAPTWLTGSFDPQLRLIYWGVGNPSPNFDGANRKGNNLYTNSVVALDASSGKLRWHFQFTPHDLHDWDSAQIPVLVDAVLDGSKRKLIAWANRNGFYYLLDRETGKFLLGTPFVKQTWADGLDVNGQPRVRQESIPTPQGSLVYPSLSGATNWWSPTYDPGLGLLYVPAVDRGGIFYLWPDRPPDVTGARLGGLDTKVPNEDMIAGVKALEVTTGRIKWQYLRHYSSPQRKATSEMGGLLSTGSRLVFGGDGDAFIAWDAETGLELWRFNAGGTIWAAPVSYEVDGRQYITVAAGRTILSFSLPEQKH
jgi:alcohol dehydrogenase (cytochrome c)